jgi:hypothetical protein
MILISIWWVTYTFIRGRFLSCSTINLMVRTASLNWFFFTDLYQRVFSQIPWSVVAAQAGRGVSASWDAEILSRWIGMLELWNVPLVLDRSRMMFCALQPLFSILFGQVSSIQDFCSTSGGNTLMRGLSTIAHTSFPVAQRLWDNNRLNILGSLGLDESRV